MTTLALRPDQQLAQASSFTREIVDTSDYDGALIILIGNGLPPKAKDYLCPFWLITGDGDKSPVMDTKANDEVYLKQLKRLTVLDLAWRQQNEDSPATWANKINLTVHTPEFGVFVLGCTIRSAQSKNGTWAGKNLLSALMALHQSEDWQLALDITVFRGDKGMRPFFVKVVPAGTKPQHGLRSEELNDNLRDAPDAGEALDYCAQELIKEWRTLDVADIPAAQQTVETTAE